MTEEQYEILCECCDSFLQDINNTVDGMAIPWLHILNEHPVNLKKYESAFNTASVPQFSTAKVIIRSVLKWITTTKSKDGWSSSSDITEKIDLLYVSHLVNEAHIGLNEDFYFGLLPEYCYNNGITGAILLNNHTGRSTRKLDWTWPSSRVPRLIFDQTLQWGDEQSLIFRLKKQCRILIARANNCSDVRKKRIFEFASKQAISNHSIATLRFFLQAIKLIQRLKPKTIVSTYEGHAWERLIFAAARQVDPSIRCIGYHHTILFPRQHALKRSLGKEYDPDLVLTAGTVTRDILTKVLLQQNTIESVESVGTHRVGTHSHKFILNDSNLNNQACLILPDGTLDECLTIFKFMLEAAEILPSVRFIIRMHPVLSFDHVANEYKNLKHLPENVELSEMTIADDFARSRWALYRGSSAAIYGTIAGLRPFYVSCKNELSIDPLYQLTTWRKIVESPDQFVEYVNDDINRQGEDLQKESNAAREYCLQYFTPIDQELFFQKLQPPPRPSLPV